MFQSQFYDCFADPSCSSSSDNDEEGASEKSPTLISREINSPNSGNRPPRRPPRRPPMNRARSSLLKASFRRMRRERIAEEEPDELNSTQSADSGMDDSMNDLQ